MNVLDLSSRPDSSTHGGSPSDDTPAAEEVLWPEFANEPENEEDSELDD